MLKNIISFGLQLICIGVILLNTFAAPAFSENIPAKGYVFPNLTLTSPASEQERTYLGIGNADTFTIDQVKSSIMLIEVVGVYCPQCHIQFPRNNKLFKMIQQNEKLGAAVKMFAIAAGATPMETAYLKKQANIQYPVIEDPRYENHKMLGEPKTPFTMIVRNNGLIEYTHFGTFADTGKLFSMIKQYVK
ncbi:MAG: hypothetical protein PHQ97_03590 [Desulfobacterales bacterium]|nr:hypothetical protein [Desulfobacterales bacterium]